MLWRYKNIYIPKLRFKEFKKEWESNTIENIFKITRGLVIAKSKISKEKNENFCYPVYSSQTKNNGLMGYYNEYLYDKAITWTTDGYAGIVSFRNEKFYCTNVCGVLLEKKYKPNLCISKIIGKETRKYVMKYLAIPKLMNNTMAKIKIFFPEQIEEQEKISRFFSLLDHQISLLENKLQLIEQIRKFIFSLNVKYDNKKIKDAFNLLEGFPFKSTDYNPKGNKVLTIKNIAINKIDASNIKKTLKVIDSKYQINKNDIICAITGAAGLKFSLSDDTYYFNQRTMKITSKNNDFEEILLLLLLFNKKKSWINSLATGSQKNISKKTIQNIFILKKTNKNILISKILNKLAKYDELLSLKKKFKLNLKKYYLLNLFT